MAILLNERHIRILFRLLEAAKPLKVSELSKEFGVSIRTIRYDLKKIDDFLKDAGLKVLKRKPNKGIEFNGSQDDKKKLYSIISCIDNSSYVLTSQERQNIILTELLQVQDFITIEHLSCLLSVSRNTIKNDLKKVKLWLERHGLKLTSLPRHGIKIEGEEKDLRRVAVSLLTEALDIKDALEIIRSPLRRKSINKLFEDIDVEFIQNTVKIAEEQLERVFSDETFSGLVIHIALAIKRIQLGKDIVIPRHELAWLRMTKEFAVASSIVKKLEEHFCVKIPEDEIGYIALHLLGGKVTTSTPTLKGNWIRTQILVSRIIEAVQKELDTDFSTDDELYRGLIEHLGPTLFRLENKLPLKNPILSEIKNNYPEIFQAVKKSINSIKEFQEIAVSEEEIGYITIHFGAALERIKTVDRRPRRVLIVCGTGIGTAKLLYSRLKAEFNNISIVDTVAIHQVDKILSEKQVDLIVSTVALNSCNIPVVVVNPLLPEKDVIKIRRKLGQKQPQIEKTDKGKCFKLFLETLMDIIEKHCIVKSRSYLLRELEKLAYLFNGHISKGAVKPMLKDLLTDKTIRINVNAKNWEEAVKIGGGILVENGFVEPRYVDAMVMNVREIGPYIVIAPGIAMPHARPEDGVKQVCMSLITLMNPVKFGNEVNDPVRLVVCFGAIDNSTHLKALSQLMSLFMDYDYMENLFNAKSVESILAIIGKFSTEK